MIEMEDDLAGSDDSMDWSNQFSSALVDQPQRSTDHIAIESVTTQTAPRSAFDDVQTVADVSELATETETVATEDVFVLKMTSPGLSSALVKKSSDNSNDRLLELIRSGALTVQVTNGASDRTLDLPATNETGGLRVIPETDGSDVYILIDTERTVFTDNTTGVTTGDLNVTVDSQGTDTPTAANVTVTPREASFETNEDGKLSLTADSNRTITGNTTVAPNTNLTVHVRSNKEETFNITRTGRVGEDGGFSFRVDFGNVTKGTRFEVLIPTEGFSEKAVTEGVLTAASSASVHLTDQRLGTNETQTVTVKDANLSEGGFLVVYNRSFLTQNRSEAHGSYQGISEYRQPGSYSNVNIMLNGDYQGEGTIIVVPHLDTNDNEEFDAHNVSIDEPYRGADGGEIIAMANASTGMNRESRSSADQYPPPPYSGVESPARSESGHNNPTGTSTTTVFDHPKTGQTTQGVDSDDSSNARLSDVDGPGFGPLTGLIAVSITAVAMLIRRS